MLIGSLCSGIGGLELGLERSGLGTTVWQSEIDKAACKVLDRNWPQVPNLGDFRGQQLPDADIVCAGFPCQPVSSAGKQTGIEDTRWLFDDIAESISGMETPPRVLVLENVRGLLFANNGRAMGRVVHGLAALGYVGQYGLIRAADVGAPHRRERVFIIAYANDFRREWGRVTWDRESRFEDNDFLPRPSWGIYSAAIRRWERIIGREAPSPSIDKKLSPTFVEWMMGFPEGWIEGLPRTTALRCLGNAAVPQVTETLGRMILSC